jgi:hypothetical protein
MPISEKIISRVKCANATAKEKELMIEILKVEDKGVFRYSADYEKIIKEYIAMQDIKEAD